MKKLIIILLIIILCVIPSYAQQQPPEPSDLATLNKINQEHSNTRKFFSDELSRQRNEFYKQMDDRAIYYEKTVDKMLANTIWKLGLLWAGIVFFIVSFNNLIRNRLEKKRFKKLKESLKREILGEMRLNDSGKMQQQVKKPIFQSKRGFDVETDELFKVDNIMPVPPAPVKKTWAEKRQEKKMQNFLKQKQKQEEATKLKEMKLRAKMGLSPEQPQPQPQPAPKEKAEVQYSNNFEVEY